MISHRKVRQIFAEYWKAQNHVEVPPIPLVPQNDPTTLFTGSGMQQLVPNLLGEPHPLGKRLYNIQRCIRAQDVDEVGNSRHDTFFEMMGNWSLGDYFKKDQLTWVFDLYTNTSKGFGLAPSRLYVTVCGGGEGISKDEESINIWKSIFAHRGITSDIGTAQSFHMNQHITLYGTDKNWWSRSGTPYKMPAGEVGGPSSEIFFDFGHERKLHEHSPWKDLPCHPNCDCGRFIEIGNSVFMQFVKQEDGSLKELPKKNVDFGGGLERVLAAIDGDPDIFKTDVFASIVQFLAPDYDLQIGDTRKRIRIIADHLRTVTQLAKDGIIPGAKEQGYFMRSLIRRALINADALSVSDRTMLDAVRAAITIFYTEDQLTDRKVIEEVITTEIQKYRTTVEHGKKELRKRLTKQSSKEIGGDVVFEIFQSTGLPPEVIMEIGTSVGAQVSLQGFEEAKKKHSDMSRSGSEQKFKGGLADHSEQVVRYHTATHLLHRALSDVLGPSVRQEGSNITGSRLRFDFFCDHKPSPEMLAEITAIINDKIHSSLPVSQIIMPKQEAENLGAKSFFKEKYPEMVKVYTIGGNIVQTGDETSGKSQYSLSNPPPYSLEFCGGPHVNNTKEIGKIDLYKLEKIGKDLYRVYGK